MEVRRRKDGGGSGGNQVGVRVREGRGGKEKGRGEGLRGWT